MRFILLLIPAAIALAQPQRPYNPFNQLCLPNMIVAGPPSGTAPNFPTCRFIVNADLPGFNAIANNTVLGNISGISAAPVGLTQAQLTALVNAFSSSLSGAAPASGGGTTNFLRADGTWAAPPGGGGGGTGNAASLVTVTFGATPAFACPSASAGTVVTFELTTTLTSNISPTITGCTNGQIVNFRLKEDGVGGRGVIWPAGWTSLAQPSPIANVETTISAVWDGSSAKGLASADGGPEVSVEQAAPAGSPAAGTEYTWSDSTNHLRTTKNPSGVLTHGVQTIDCSGGSQLLQKVNADGSGTCASGGAGSAPFTNFQGNTGNVAMTGVGNDIDVFTVAAPALAAGACYVVEFSIDTPSFAGGNLFLKAGTTTIATVYSGGGATPGFTFRLLYCNNAGVQNAQTLIFPFQGSFASGSGAIPSNAIATIGNVQVTTPTAVDWSTGHSLHLTLSAASGNAVGKFWHVATE